MSSEDLHVDDATKNGGSVDITDKNVGDLGNKSEQEHGQAEVEEEEQEQQPQANLGVEEEGPTAVQLSKRVQASTMEQAERVAQATKVCDEFG